MTGLAAAARKHLGARYVARGYQPGLGLCCYGLVRAACAELGHELPDWKVARRLLRLSQEEIEERLPLRLVPGIRENAIALMSNGGGPPNSRALHLAIVGRRRQRLTMIHTSSHLGRVVEEPLLATAYQSSTTFWTLSASWASCS